MDKLKDLQDLMHTCVEMGYLRAQIDLLPSSDRLRKKNAEELLVRHGFSKSILSRWVSEGLIIEHKEKNNSPIWYSVMNLMDTIGAVRYKKYLT